MAIASGIATATCGRSDKSTGPGAGPLTKIVVTPDTATIPIAGTTNLAATGQDAQGRTVNGVTFFWASQNDSVATVTQSGQVTGARTGVVQIAASAQGVSGFATVTVTPKAVGSIVVTPSSATIRIATTLQLQDTVKDASGAVLPGQAVTWSTDSAATASVDGNGLVTGRQLGTATITASAGGKSARAFITVSQIPVKTVTISPTNPVVSVSQTLQLTAVTADSAGTVLPGRVVRWSSATPAVATIDSISGVLTGVAPGTSVIKATSEGVFGTVTATVNPAPVNSVVLSPSVSQLHVGQSETISATVTDVNGNPVGGAVVTFTTNNANIASITSSTNTTTLILAGPGTGTATITGTSGAKTGTATVIVSLVPVDSVNVNAAHDTITVGHQDTLTATAFDSTGTALPGRPVTWKSSNAAVATVSATGIVTTLKPGTVVIFATISGVQGSVTIVINPVPIGSVSVSPTADTLLQGGQQQLTVVVRDSLGSIVNNPQVTWTSTNNTIASSTQTGLVTGVNTGTALIIATAGGKADTNTTLVLPPVATVTVTPGTSTITTAQTVQLTATLKDGSGNVLTGRTVQWSSSATASVSATGLVTPVDTGTATITATAVQPSGNVKGTATVTISQVPAATVTVTPASSTITLGQTKQLTATVKDSSGNVLAGRTIQWTANPSSKATVSASGLVTSTDTGTVTVTATVVQASGNVSGTASVTINLVPVATVTVAPASSTITLGQTQQLTATLKDGGGNVLTGRTVQWSAAPSSKATVNASGLVTSTDTGTVTITATVVQAGGNVSGNATVTINPVPVASVVVFPTPDTIFASAPGNTVQLQDSTYDAGHHYLPGRTVTWSATGGVAGVNAASGLVTASNTAAGSATITATSSDGPAGSGTVVVLGHSQTVNPTNTSTALSVGNLLNVPSADTATTQVLDSFGTDVTATRMVTWTSADPTTITINGSASPVTVPANTAVVLQSISNNSLAVSVTVAAVDNPSANATVNLVVGP